MESKKLIKIVSAALCTVFALLLFGCASGGSTQEKSEGGQPAAESSEKSEPVEESAKAPAFSVAWDGGAPTSFGGVDSSATVGNVAVVQSSTGDYLLTVDFEYTNQSEDARNFINDYYCNVNAFQGGIELDDPGITSEEGVYNYGDAFTQIKKGATIETQLVWVLRDTASPVELEFGINSEYKPELIKTLSITDN